MQNHPKQLTLALLALLTINASAAVLYVDAISTNPVVPYTNWSTAAREIQSAVDASAAGDTVLVTNGIYSTGGRAVFGMMTNRVAIDRAITVQSVTGAGMSIIQGAWAPGATNGDGAVRCAYLTNGATLIGFTLTNGATRTSGDVSHERSGGGVWCEAPSAVVSNCVLVGNAAYYRGGGAYSGTLNDCTLMWNWAATRIGKDGGEGGGAYSASLNNCTILSNAAWYGGGAYYGTLSNCTLRGNSASSYGGGTYSTTLIGCALTGNSAISGGGAWSSTLGNCTLTRNSATDGGGGVAYGTLTHCTLTTNKAGHGGGAVSSTLDNCLLTGNSASYGGGAYSGTLNNCTLTGNSADGPGSAGGGGACSAVLSNCTLAANSAYSSGGGANSGTLNNCTLSGNSAFNGGGAYSATLNGCTLTNNWADFGGGAYSGTLSNCMLVGNFTIVQCEGCGEGAGACLATLNNCTLVGNRGGIGGGASRSTLNNCKVIGNSGGGVYNPEQMNNCTVVGNTGYQGGGVMIGSTFFPSLKLRNCVIYYNSSTLGEANYANAQTGSMGYCCTTPQPPGGIGNITNAPVFLDHAGGNLRLQSNSPCINAGNNAYALGSTDLDGRPRIVAGTVDIGAYEFQTGTSGLFLGWLQRYGLPTDGSADYADGDHDRMNNWLEFCSGTNPTNSLSALRLVSVTYDASVVSVTWQSVTNQTYFLERSTSVSGHSSFFTVATNIAGQTGTTTYTDTNAIDSGPFYYRVGVQASGWQEPSGGSIISYAWLQQYGLPTDGSADYTDPDHDGLNNWQEWRASTDPTNSASVLTMLTAVFTNNPVGVTVSWQSVSNRTYYVQRGSDLRQQTPFESIQSNIVGQAGTTSFTDLGVTNATAYFYRVGVQ